VYGRKDSSIGDRGDRSAVDFAKRTETQYYGFTFHCANRAVKEKPLYTMFMLPFVLRRFLHFQLLAPSSSRGRG